MKTSELAFHVTDEELVILNAFFLALPLPMVMAHNEESYNLDLQETIQTTTQSLIEKGWLSQEISGTQNTWVLPELAQMLRDMAYGNELVHLYYHEQGKDAVQVAFYRRDTRVVRQTLYSHGEHVIQPYGSNLDSELLDGYITEVTNGDTGTHIGIPLESWHYLLSSRVTGIAEDVLQDLENSQPGNDELMARLRFAKDVLAAPAVLEVTCIYDRIENQTEKASFVFTGSTNWMILRSDPSNHKDLLHTIKASKIHILQAIEGLFTPFHKNQVKERED